LKTDSDICAYQISYNSLDTPISKIYINTPYPISLTNGQVKYYIYRHTTKLPIFVLQMIATGSAFIYA